jgi:TPR repeat protein
MEGETTRRRQTPELCRLRFAACAQAGVVAGCRPAGDGVVSKSVRGGRYARDGAPGLDVSHRRANDQGTPDFEQFARLSKTAAQAGDTQGMWQLYGAHNNGNWGLPKDDAEAIRWVRTAAERGDIRAMNALASEHQRGSRVPRDEVAAMSWWRRAADAGDGKAMTKVAFGYLNGTGGLPRNEAEGVRWTRAAVEAEEVEAASWLAGWYENGERGFATNPTEATAIWRRLARSANPQTADAALYKLGEQERDRLFRERLEQQKATSWDFLAAMVKISAVMSAVVLVTGGGGSLTDMLSYMNDATENAPRFIAAFVDGCESQAENGKDVPDIDIVNEILAKHETGYQVIDGMVTATAERAAEQASGTRAVIESPKRAVRRVAKPDLTSYGGVANTKKRCC